ncbi:MAG: protein kinase, partial [Deltaproteobacteria bacterium]|nr:protein kinase [Deltaproteobacteria bacterium]
MPDTFDRLKAALAGRYAIEHELGAGGMATVYLAEDLKHHRKVAVKVLRPDLAAALGPERFLREIEIAAGLTHPHIVPLYDSGEADGFLFYVLPYIEGESLRAKLTREGELPITDAVRILRDVVDALASAHKHGVVHRDIKPDNVLLLENHALVTDFGVAKAVSEATGRQQLTTAGVALGTPAYMAPEQAVADPHIDHRADIYAVGALAYELLTGRPPFTGTTPQMVLSAHVTEAPEPVTKDRQAVPPALAQLVMKCLEKKPADRWQSAEDLLTNLEALATPSGGVTPTDTRPISAALRPLTRSRRGAMIGGAALLAALAIGWFALGRGGGGSDESGVPRLVVLPARNLGSPDNAYFADGIGEEISTRLGGIQGLDVLGRMTAERYRDTEKTPQEIGAELNADFLLHITVRGEGPATSRRVRVSTELVRASTAAQVWAQSYVAEAVEDLFQAQSDIAGRVAQELGVTLGTSEEPAISDRPTNNDEAYDYYLRGNARFTRSERYQDYQAAADLYQRAVDLDPNFALAQVGLGKAHTEIYWFSGDRTSRRLELAKEALDRALALDPDLPEAHGALGLYHYHGFLDYDRALQEFAIALRGEPSNAEFHANRAWVLRRQGKLDECLASYERALALDPQAHVWASDLAYMYAWVGRYADAHQLFDRTLDYAPDYALAYVYKAGAHVHEGELENARKVLRRGIETLGLDELLNDLWSWNAVLLDAESREQVVGLRLSPRISDTTNYYLAKAFVSRERSDLARARALFDSAAVTGRETAEANPLGP